jgi:hypothetical protein
MQYPLSFPLLRDSQSFSVLFQREPSYCVIIRPAVLAHSFPFLLPLSPSILELISAKFFRVALSIQTNRPTPPCQRFAPSLAK